VGRTLAPLPLLAAQAGTTGLRLALTFVELVPRGAVNDGAVGPAAPAAASSWSTGLAEGDAVELLDSHSRRWRPASVRGVSPDGATLHVVPTGWWAAALHQLQLPAADGEELPRGSDLLARPGTYTGAGAAAAGGGGAAARAGGRATRRPQGEPLTLDAVALAVTGVAVDAYIASVEGRQAAWQFTPEERDAFARVELPGIVEEALSSSIDTAELRDGVSALNAKVLQLCACHLRRLD
jgi:hypothetical protein